MFTFLVFLALTLALEAPVFFILLKHRNWLLASGEYLQLSGGLLLFPLSGLPAPSLRSPGRNLGSLL